MASKRRLRKRKCGDKIRFTKEQAQQKTVETGLRHYRCPFCGYWHLGNTCHSRGKYNEKRIEYLLDNLGD